jgi:uncharacterized membrane protein
MDLPPPYRYDGEGKLRVIVNAPLTFPGLVDTAFSQIRQFAGSSVAVHMRLLEVIATILPHTHITADRRALLRHALRIRRSGEMASAEEDDWQEIGARYREVVRLQAQEDGQG